LRGPEPDDTALVARLKAGDERAWPIFLDRYERLIYAVPRRMGLDADEAADVFQEVAIAFLKGLPRLRDAKTIPRWLAQTAFRIARDRRARRKRELRPEDETFWDTRPDPTPQVLDALESEEARRAVSRALAVVTPRCRELLTLLFLADPAPSYAEIARQVGQPIGALGPTRQRCLARMLEVLAPGGIRTAPSPTLKSGAAPSRARTRRPS
jgi:RNA polymerase sigma factor (sigma-70 family)